ncbi:MAG: hypothetical protein ACI3YK_01000 [Eubacteriales bacterium]
MKLTSAYVSGFGKLTDYTLNYHSTLTVLCMENGWGKSTLAIFHKAMFYGLDSTQKIRGEQKERERFKPWTSAPFGGWLEFETDDGKAYRIERTFGKKASEDTFRLYSLPDMRISEDFPDPVGLSLFGLNARCFIRSVFCTGSLWSPPDKSDPDSGLLAERFGENASESKNLDGAVKKLEEWRREYQTKTGDRGKIPDQRREIYDLEEKIRELQSLSKDIAENRSQSGENDRKIAACTCELSALKESIDRAAKAEADNALRAHYRILSDGVDQLRREQQSASSFFGDRLPTEKELEALRELSVRRDQAKKQAEIADKPFSGQEEYARLSAGFSSGLPDEEAMSDYIQKDRRLSHLKASRDEILGSPEFVRQSRLFSGKIPDEEQMDRLIEKVRSDKALPEGKHSGRLPQVLLGVGTVLILLGIPSIVLWGLIGLIPLVIGIGSALFGLLNLLKKPASPPPATDESVSEFLSAYGLSDGDPLSSLYQLRMDVSQYRSQIRRLDEVTRETETLAADLREFLDYYRSPDITTLSEDVRRYPELCKQREIYLNERQQADRELALISDRLSKELARYPVDGENPSEAIGVLGKRLSDLSAISARLSDAEQNLKIFKASHSELDLESPPTAGDSVETLRQKEQILQTRRDEYTARTADLAAEYSRLTQRADQLPALEERLTILKDEYEKSRATLNAIVHAEELLKQANQNLSDRYLTDVQRKFTDYAKILLADTGETDRYRMDGTLTVLSEEAGKQRPAASLSRGRQDLVSLCARLALSDAMFEGKADFLILDDPFVNLDDGRMKTTLALLEKLAEDRQILYLTCSESRVPG